MKLFKIGALGLFGAYLLRNKRVRKAQSIGYKNNHAGENSYLNPDTQGSALTKAENEGFNSPRNVAREF